MRRFAGLFGRVRAPLDHISFAASYPKEDDLNLAVISRIKVEGEELPSPGTYGDYELTCRRLMRRLDWQLKKSRIGVEELINSYPTEVRAILLYESHEKGRKKGQAAVESILLEAGLKPVQPGMWVLPPTKTPPGLESQESLELWFRQRLEGRLDRHVEYVFPFIASVDLKRVVAERRGVRDATEGKTVFNALTVDEVVPQSHIYTAMKSKGLSAKEVILSGDIPFLASAFSSKKDLDVVRSHELELGDRLGRAKGAAGIGLAELAQLKPEHVARACYGVIPHTKEFSVKLVGEAQYWTNFFGGAVPSQVGQAGPL